MKKEITSRKDISIIITSFYNKLIADDKMYPFFKDFVEEKTLDKHLEIITSFWEDILLHTNNYKNNTMQKHLDFNKKMKFSKEHFDLWLGYLSETLMELYEGDLAEQMKMRAQSIAMVMQLKMNLYKN